MAASRITTGSIGATSVAAQSLAGAKWPWVLIALGPAILAIATWDTSFHMTGARDWVRGFGLPLTIIEIVFAAYALRRRFEPFKMLSAAPRWVQAALIVIVAIAFLDGVFVAPDGQLSLLRTSLWLIHLTFGLSVAHVLSVEPDSPPIWHWVLGGLCAYVLLFIIFVASLPDPAKLPWQAWQYFGLGVRNIRHTGFFLAVGGAVALALSATAKDNREYVATVLIASVMLGAAFWSGSRGPIVGVWAGFVLTLFVFPSLRSMKAALALVASTGIGALLSLISPAPNTLYGLSRIQFSATRGAADLVVSGRLELWGATWRAILERPLFGYGEGQLHLVIPEAQHVQFHPHDIFFQIAFHWGFVGAICFVAIGAFLAVRVFRSARQNGDRLAAPFAVAATLLFMSLNDGTLFFTYPSMMAALAIGSLAGRVSRQITAAPTVANRPSTA